MRGCIPKVNPEGLARSYIGQITSGKRVGAQNRKRPNRDIKFSKSGENS